MPAITIIVGCFNASAFLQEALTSVFSQSLTDYEILVVNDASSDQSADILARNSIFDKRLKILHNNKNQGLAKSLNLAIDSSDSEYIARFDADDLMYPERLQTQFHYLQNYPVDLIGSYATAFGQGKSRLLKYPTTDEQIRLQLLFQSPFCHPSVIFRRNKLGKLRYDSAFPYAEDYALWILMAHRCRMANIALPLIRYRRHPHQVSAKTALQNADAGQLRLLALQHLGITPTTDEQHTHATLRRSQPYATKDDLSAAEAWLTKLKMHIGTPSADQQLMYEWCLCCVRAAHFGLWTWRHYKRSSLYRPIYRHLPHENQLFLLCLGKVGYRSKTYNILEKLG